MKQFCLLILILSVFVSQGQTPGKGIRFEEQKEWKKVVKKAKKEKKLIFVDCYGPGCAPCKVMLKSVFPQEKVGDFYNAHFINVKYDIYVEADGKNLKDKHRVYGLPTMLFIDPQTEALVHKLVGAGSADWLIDNGKLAMDPGNNWSGLHRRYEAGERNSDLFKRYMGVLANLRNQKELERVTIEYLASFPKGGMNPKEQWELIRNNISDPLSAPLQEVLVNLKFYEDTYGKEEVGYKVEYCINHGISLITSNDKFDEKRYAETVALYRTIDHDCIPGALSQLYTLKHVADGRYDLAVDDMREALKYNLFRNGSEQNFICKHVSILSNCSDTTVIRKAIDIMDERCAEVADDSDKANLMFCKSKLLRQLGEEAKAGVADKEGQKYLEKSRNK